MQQAIIIFTLVSCCYGLAMARCLRKGEGEGFVEECLEYAAPGITNNLQQRNLVIKAIAGDAPLDDSDPIQRIAKQAVQCYGNKLDQVYPEFTEIWKGCDEKTHSKQERRDCVHYVEQKLCPNMRSKRSTFSSNMDLFMSSSAELQKHQNEFQSRNSELLTD